MYLFIMFLRTSFLLFWAVRISGKNIFPAQVFQNRLLRSSLTTSQHRCFVRDVDWMECILRCLRDGNCVSYNFNRTKNTCELNAFGLVNPCEGKELLHSNGVVFQQIREEKNQLQCMASETCGPDQTQVGKESCKVRPRTSCNDILKNGESRGNGEYTINPGSKELHVYCDMVTDGGGWTLIKNSTIMVKPVSVTMMLTSNLNSLSKHHDLSLLINPSGLKKVKDQLGFQQIRWFCYKRSVGRTIHIMTNNDAAGLDVIRYFTESTVPARACDSFTHLPDDTSKLSQNCNEWGANRGQGVWGNEHYNGQQRIHRFVALWMKYPDYKFSMLPGEYMCDDNEGRSYDVNDVWAMYVR